MRAAASTAVRFTAALVAARRMRSAASASTAVGEEAVAWPLPAPFPDSARSRSHASTARARVPWRPASVVPSVSTNRLSDAAAALSVPGGKDEVGMPRSGEVWQIAWTSTFRRATRSQDSSPASPDSPSRFSHTSTRRPARLGRSPGPAPLTSSLTGFDVPPSAPPCHTALHLGCTVRLLLAPANTSAKRREMRAKSPGRLLWVNGSFRASQGRGSRRSAWDRFPTRSATRLWTRTRGALPSFVARGSRPCAWPGQARFRGADPTRQPSRCSVE